MEHLTSELARGCRVTITKVPGNCQARLMLGDAVVLKTYGKTPVVALWNMEEKLNARVRPASK